MLVSFPRRGRGGALVWTYGDRSWAVVFRGGAWGSDLREAGLCMSFPRRGRGGGAGGVDRRVTEAERARRPQAAGGDGSRGRIGGRRRGAA